MAVQPPDFVSDGKFLDFVQHMEFLLRILMDDFQVYWTGATGGITRRRFSAYLLALRTGNFLTWREHLEGSRHEWRQGRGGG